MKALVCSVLMVAVASAAVEDDLRDADKYFDRGDWAKAASAYDRAIAESPGQVSAAAYGKRAAIFIILKDYKDGLAFVDRMRARVKDAPELLEQQALMLWETDRRDEAVAVAEKVVAARPAAFTNEKILGEYYASRDPAKTAAAYEAYLANRPSDLEAGDVLPRVRLAYADLALARVALGAGDDAGARDRYGKAAHELEIVETKHRKQPSAQVNADNGLCAAYTGLEKWDQAIPRCEKVAADGKHVDPNKSVYFNLATAYLARKQPGKARAVAIEFTKQRPNEARGFMLVGDTFFADRDWPHALDAYQQADKLVVPAETREKAQVSIRLGKTYRRMPDADGKNVQRAIDQLAPALAASPNNTELAIELADAYLAAGDGAKATAIAEKLIAEKPSPELHVLAGRGRFAQRQLVEARAHFEAAHQARPADVAIRRDLVIVIDEQAYDAGRDGKPLLEQALALDPESAPTLTDLAVLAIDRGDCDGAQPVLAKLERAPGADPVVRLRLLAKSDGCLSRPDAGKAVAAYAQAEQEASKANARLALAEIDTEYAPMIWDSDLLGAIAKLEIAVQIAGDDPESGPAAKRTVALAISRGGGRAMGQGRAADAVVDFERAAHDPALLHGSEPLAFDFSHALALLDAGRNDQAAKLFKGLAARGNQASYLKPPFGKLGGQLFAAYAAYRSGTIATRTQAAADLAKLRADAGTFAPKIDELVAATWEEIAVEQWRAGQAKLAAAALANADRTAPAAMTARLAVDRAALGLDKSKLGALEALGGTPPEALVNVGIVYDLLGRPRDAYDAWVKARGRGVQAPNLAKWIDAKKRIYGYP